MTEHDYNALTANNLYRAWCINSIITLNGKKYHVGKMSYGDYFLEPISWKGGERDGHSPNTLWLKRIDKTDKYETE